MGKNRQYGLKLTISFPYLSMCFKVTAIYQKNYMRFFLLRLAYFAKHEIFQLHPFCRKRQNFIFNVLYFHIFFIHWCTTGLISHVNYYELSFITHGIQKITHIFTSFHLSKSIRMKLLDHVADLFLDIRNFYVVFHNTCTSLHCHQQLISKPLPQYF